MHEKLCFNSVSMSDDSGFIIECVSLYEDAVRYTDSGEKKDKG